VKGKGAGFAVGHFLFQLTGAFKPIAMFCIFDQKTKGKDGFDV